LGGRIKYIRAGARGGKKISGEKETVDGTLLRKEFRRISAKTGRETDNPKSTWGGEERGRGKTGEKTRPA